MRSYGLGLGLVALLSALFAVQNQDVVAVKFLVWDFALSQGIWEVVLFVVGVVLMWIISLAATWEIRYHNRRDQERSRRRIAALEKEKEALLAAMKAAGLSQEEITFVEEGPLSL